MLHRVIGEDIELTTDLAPSLGVVRADAGQLDQVILNLSINARDAMAGGGQLTITTQNVSFDPEYSDTDVDIPPGEYVMLAVTDSGIGMDLETQRRIFEPFFTTKEVGQGTGLGLATVYGIVKQSGGNVEVYSEEAIGTTFKIYLPRVAKDAEDTITTDNSSEMTTGTETLLLVEDEEMVRNLSRQIL